MMGPYEALKKAQSASN